MKLDIKNGLFSLIGKWSEYQLIEKVIELAVEDYPNVFEHGFDESTEDMETDISAIYDRDYKVEDIQKIWRDNKKTWVKQAKSQLA